jgi:elongator complex protein 4
MPSFTRRSAPTTPAAPDGTHPSPSTSQPLLPTGIPSFDDLLSGGLPLGGTLLVLAPDTHSAWSRLVARYFLAIGLLTSCRNVVVGEPGLGRELVKGCMWVDERAQGGGSESEGEDVGATGEGKGGKKIAWRYEGMKKFKTTVGECDGSWHQTTTREIAQSSLRTVDPTWTPAHTAPGGSNPLNLTKTLPSSALHEAESSRQQVYIPLDDDEPGNQLRPGPSDRSWPVLASALNRLRGILDEVPRGDKLATRVVINELGSVDWGDVSAQVSGVTSKAAFYCNRCVYAGPWNRR